MKVDHGSLPTAGLGRKLSMCVVMSIPNCASLLHCPDPGHVHDHWLNELSSEIVDGLKARDSSIQIAT